MISNFYCPGDLSLLNTFDLGYAPSLLFYSYIPIVAVSLLLTLFVMVKNHFNLESKLLFLLAGAFSLWVCNIILQWITVPVNLNYFEWQITPLLEILIPVITLYFTSVFLSKGDISIRMKLFLASVTAAVSLLLLSSFNTISFDVLNCQANLGQLIYYVYGFEIFSVFLVLYFCIKRYRSVADPIFKKQILYFAPGVVFFLTIFSVGQTWGEITKVYEINLIGPIGMLLFLAFLSYIIVKFKTFNVKVLGAQVLLFALATFILGILFIDTIEYAHIIASITLVFVLILGIALVRSVHKEVEQRERIEKLNEQLEGLIHFIGHEVKGYLTKSQGVFSMIMDDDYGTVSPDLKTIVGTALHDNKEGVESIMTMLNAVNTKKGTMKFNMEPFDMKAAVLKIVAELKQNAEMKGLTMETKIDDGDYPVLGDGEQIAKHVVRNLIDNSVRYTLAGGLKIVLKKQDNKIIFSVKDTGVGITDEDKARLFTEGGRGVNSVKVNVHSTGYGLFFAKGIVEAHKGRIWAESEGADKGSTFYVELPVNNSLS